MQEHLSLAFGMLMEQETVLYTDVQTGNGGLPKEDSKIYLDVAFSLVQVTAY